MPDLMLLDSAVHMGAATDAVATRRAPGMAWAPRHVRAHWRGTGIVRIAGAARGGGRITRGLLILTEPAASLTLRTPLAPLWFECGGDVGAAGLSGHVMW